MQYPEGYLEARARKEKEKENSKREAQEEEEEEMEEEGAFTSPRRGKRKSKSGGGCLCGLPPCAHARLPALTHSALSPQGARPALGPRGGHLRRAR